jgi:hypothetical protein
MHGQSADGRRGSTHCTGSGRPTLQHARHGPQHDARTDRARQRQQHARTDRTRRTEQHARTCGLTARGTGSSTAHARKLDRPHKAEAQHARADCGTRHRQQHDERSRRRQAQPATHGQTAEGRRSRTPARTARAADGRRSRTPARTDRPHTAETAARTDRPHAADAAASKGRLRTARAAARTDGLHTEAAAASTTRAGADCTRQRQQHDARTC